MKVIADNGTFMNTEELLRRTDAPTAMTNVIINTTLQDSAQMEQVMAATGKGQQISIKA